MTDTAPTQPDTELVEGRAWPTARGRWGIQQCIKGRWTFATIGCGYETAAEAVAALRGLPKELNRVADRQSGDVLAESIREDK